MEYHLQDITVSEFNHGGMRVESFGHYKRILFPWSERGRLKQ